MRQSAVLCGNGLKVIVRYTSEKKGGEFQIALPFIAENFKKLKTMTAYITLILDKEILAWSKLKSFADKQFHVGQMVQQFFDGIENIVGKGENTGYQHFPLFNLVFSKGLPIHGC